MCGQCSGRFQTKHKPLSACTRLRRNNHRIRLGDLRKKLVSFALNLWAEYHTIHISHLCNAMHTDRAR